MRLWWTVISGLASAAAVYEPTVVRLCRSLGYEGWQNFKLSLAQDLALGSYTHPLPLNRDELAQGLSSKIYARAINT